MIINKICSKCGRTFVDASMFGQLTKCDTCSEIVIWAASNSSNRPIPAPPSYESTTPEGGKGR